MEKMRVYDHTLATSYEQQRHQHNKNTATVWCMHIRCIDESDLEWLLKHFEEHFPVKWLTGEYVITSWKTWGEEPADANDISLVVYYTADSPQTAFLNGKYMAQTAYCWQPSRIALSTSGDWAEQININSAQTEDWATIRTGM